MQVSSLFHFAALGLLLFGQEDPEDSHAHMVRELAELRDRMVDDHPYLGLRGLNRAQTLIERFSGEVSAEKAARVHQRMGQHLLRLGRNEEAITSLHAALEAAQSQEQPDPVFEANLRYKLAIAYMRWGETRNCVALHTAESCLLPIQGSGVHADQEGSRGAIAQLEAAIASEGANDALRGASRWLLNVMYMTIGGYPDDVPEELLIPPEIFRSEVEFPRFRDVAPGLDLNAFDLAGGSITEDFDGDGDLDLMTSTWDTAGPMHYFENEGDGTFTDRTSAAGLDGLFGGLNMNQADYDGDGAVDALVLRGAWLGGFGRHPNSLLRNDGSGTFTDVSFDVGLTGRYPTQAGAWVDYDLDGDLDLFIGNESMESDPFPSELYRNDGDGKFTEVAEEAGVRNLRFAKGVTAGDVDGDGYPELYVSNNGEPNRLYANRGDGTFTDVAEKRGVTLPLDSFATWFWDHDNDGALDLFVTGYYFVPSADRVAQVARSYIGLPITAELPCFYRGDGAGGFRDVRAELGVTELSITMGANFGDLDNDGFLDVFLGTGYPAFDGLIPNIMYRNRRGEAFDDVTFAGGFGHLQKGHAISFADLDNDGDQDVHAQMGGAYPGDAFGNALFENPGFGNHWLKVDLVGTESNRSAYGARIRVVFTEDGAERAVHRHVNTSGSFGASPLMQHVGVGKAAQVDVLEIRWPRTGATQTFRDVAVDQRVRIVEGEDELTVVPEKSFRFDAE